MSHRIFKLNKHHSGALNVGYVCKSTFTSSLLTVWIDSVGAHVPMLAHCHNTNDNQTSHNSLMRGGIPMLMRIILN